MMMTLMLSAGCAKAPPPQTPVEPPPALPPGPAVSFDKDVKPIVDTRCVVCHGCYDAPCQAVLSSHQGISRGATKKNVYDTSRLEAAQPTRLFLDAGTDAGWRELGFWPIAPNADGTWSRSLMQRMLTHGRANKLPPDAELPTSVDLDIDRTLQCPTEDEFEAYAANNPWGGMPYAVAPLSDEEFFTLARWLSQGAPGPERKPALPAALETQVDAYEKFLNRIEDRFWVAFLDPDYDLSVTDPTYLPAAAGDLVLPAEDAGDYEPGDLWAKYWLKRKRYVQFRSERYVAGDPQKRGMPLAAIWDGDGRNSNALLTVMRHFDNAEVERGFVGAIPKTAWVIDYPILERIYYDLVAGYNVFGGAAHQVATRLYMDYLRLESEDLFLSFLPKKTREPLRDSWYRGLRARLKLFLTDRDPGWTRGTQIVFESDDPKAELLLDLLQRGDGLWPVEDPINRCAAPPCGDPEAPAAQREVARHLQTIAAVRGPFVAPLPDIALLRVRAASAGGDLVYAIVHDRAHTNVAFMFGEHDRLLPADDILTILPGYRGSYPNFFFEAPAESMGEFVAQLSAVKDEESFDTFVARWGVRRSSPRFWATADWLQADFAKRQPVLAGLLDLNRYKDP